jgi:hypothetical protein
MYLFCMMSLISGRAVAVIKYISQILPRFVALDYLQFCMWPFSFHSQTCSTNSPTKLYKSRLHHRSWKQQQHPSCTIHKHQNRRRRTTSLPCHLLSLFEHIYKLTMSFMDKVKRASRTVVDTGAKTILKVCFNWNSSNSCRVLFRLASVETLLTRNKGSIEHFGALYALDSLI